MFKNYLKVALRNIARHKGYSFINITGLAMGIALFILIMLFVENELSYDQFNRHKDCVYRLELDNSAMMPPAAGKAITNHFPEVEACVRFTIWHDCIVEPEEKKIKVKDLLFADTGVFDIFTFPFVHGDPGTALNEPTSLVLTQQTARKLFGGANPVGKVVETRSPNVRGKLDFKITGVIQDPDKFHIPMDAIANFSLLVDLYGPRYNEYMDDDWSHPTYLKLPPNYDKTHFQEKLNAFFIQRYQFKEPRAQLVALKDLYFHRGGKLGEHYRKTGNLRLLYLYIGIGILILFVACVNFINLSTARGGMRALEVGIRKVVGADRSGLMAQFLGESILIVGIAFIFGILLAELLLLEFNRLIDDPLTLGALSGPLFILAAIGAVIGLGIIAGLYPALYLSSFQPISVLSGEKTKGRVGLRFRRLLFVFQFTISIILIINTLMMKNQLTFMRGKDLGFHKEQILTMRLNSSILKKQAVFREKLLASPHISAVSYSCRVPGDNWWTWTVRVGTRQTSIRVNAIDPGYLDLMDIDVIAGRNFQRDLTTDKQKKFILNETAMRLFELEPGHAVGHMVEETPYGRGEIIGVVKDFHFNSLHKRIEPLLFYWDERPFTKGSIKISTTGIATAVAHVRETWEGMSPAFPFEYSFLDESFDRQYKMDDRLFNYFKYFSFIGIFISSLGLLGLMSFMVNRRRKEIGIRKSLGASVSGIVIFLSRDYIKWVAVSNVIAWPVAYYFMDRWLRGFAYRTDIGIETFILSGLLTLVIAVITVSFLSIRASLARPVEALRYE